MRLDDERDQLKKLDALVLIEYIKSSVEVLVSLKADDEHQNTNRKSLSSL